MHFHSSPIMLKHLKTWAFAFLNVGELEKGLEEYEWRWKSKENFQ